MLKKTRPPTKDPAPAPNDNMKSEPFVILSFDMYSIIIHDMKPQTAENEMNKRPIASMFMRGFTVELCALAPAPSKFPGKPF